MKFNQILIAIVFDAIFRIKLILTSCGIPSIPFNAQIKSHQIKHEYEEGDSVDYYCELEQLKLVGPPSRRCQNGRWIGVIPRCVEEIDSNTMSGIGIVDSHNQTDLDNGTVVDYKEFKPNECMELSQKTRPITWRLNLTKTQRHVSYMEIEVLNKKNMLNFAQASDFITSVKVNDIRECATQLMEYSSGRFCVNVTCSFTWDMGTDSDDWENDFTDGIAFAANDTEVTICKIKLYKMPHKVHHWCGSADSVPHSRRVFIRKNNQYSGNSNYRYFCDQGFRLEGNQDVRCGVDNNWLDEFPICKPEINCPFTLTNQGITRHMINGYHSEGIITAVVGSVVLYFCEEDPNQRSIMIGDSVRVCDADGDWSGTNPMCIYHKELEEYLEHIEDVNGNEELLEMSSEPIQYIVGKNAKEELSCGIPAMPLFAKPITQPKSKHLNRHADLRSSYPNGTVISYQCESAYTLVTGDFEERTCVNGKWVGKVGKCSINLGNKLLLTSITVSHLDEHGESVIDSIDELNVTNFDNSNENFVFRYDPSKKGDCYNFVIEKKQRWTLRFDKRANISYFMVILYPGGFFDGKRHITKPEILKSSPLSAKTSENDCVLTSAWDYHVNSNDKIGTYFHFTCDLTQKERFVEDFSWITLEIDPKQITKSYKSKSISICSLEVFTSKNGCGCGTPDIPLHSSVEKDSVGQKWSYHCEPGNPSVNCGPNGRWQGHFPYCRKKSACSIISNKSDLEIAYKNLMKTNGKGIAIIDSVANYSCVQSSSAKTLLIGSKLRVCNRFNGNKWSGSQPFCLDPSQLSKKEVESHSNVIIFTIIISAICFLVFIVVILLIVRKKIKMNSNLMDNNNIESPVFSL